MRVEPPAGGQSPSSTTRPSPKPAPPGKSKGIPKAARAQAAREGHLSYFGRSDRGG